MTPKVFFWYPAQTGLRVTSEKPVEKPWPYSSISSIVVINQTVLWGGLSSNRDKDRTPWWISSLYISRPTLNTHASSQATLMHADTYQDKKKTKQKSYSEFQLYERLNNMFHSLLSVVRASTTGLQFSGLMLIHYSNRAGSRWALSCI